MDSNIIINFAISIREHFMCQPRAKRKLSWEIRDFREPKMQGIFVQWELLTKVRQYNASQWQKKRVVNKNNLDMALWETINRSATPTTEGS